MKKFQKIFVLMMVAITSAVSFTSCGDDDDDPQFSDDRIVGTWQFVHDIGWIKENGDIVEEYDEDCDELVMIEFTSSGTFIHTDDDGADRGIYKLDGEKLLMRYHDGEVVRWNVKQLDDNTLQMEWSEIYGGNDVEIIEYHLCTFRRLK